MYNDIFCLGGYWKQEYISSPLKFWNILGWHWFASLVHKFPAVPKRKRMIYPFFAWLSSFNSSSTSSQRASLYKDLDLLIVRLNLLYFKANKLPTWLPGLWGFFVTNHLSLATCHRSPVTFPCVTCHLSVTRPNNVWTVPCATCHMSPKCHLA